MAVIPVIDGSMVCQVLDWSTRFDLQGHKSAIQLTARFHWPNLFGGFSFDGDLIAH